MQRGATNWLVLLSTQLLPLTLSPCPIPISIPSPFAINDGWTKFLLCDLEAKPQSQQQKEQREEKQDSIESDINRKGNINQHFTLDCPEKGWRREQGKESREKGYADRPSSRQTTWRGAEGGGNEDRRKVKVKVDFRLIMQAAPTPFPFPPPPLHSLSEALKQNILINWGGKFAACCCYCCCWVRLATFRLPHAARCCQLLNLGRSCGLSAVGVVGVARVKIGFLMAKQNRTERNGMEWNSGSDLQRFVCLMEPKMNCVRQKERESEWVRMGVNECKSECASGCASECVSECGKRLWACLATCVETS